jgi:ER membrane protein complex subunit 2
MTSAVEPRPFSDPAAALQLSQKAPSLIAKASSVATSLPWSLVGTPESPETWMDLAQLFYASLRTSDDTSAQFCLEKLASRFGADNDKIMALRGMYQEALAEDEAALKTILAEYNKILAENPMNIPIHKRRIALLKSLTKPQDAIAPLVDLLESFPTDVEGWCELSELYQAQGLIPQAIYSLEEALLTVPNAWNLHARLGELEYLNAASSSEGSEAAVKSLEQAIQRFSRSIELCHDYLRAYYGLKLAVAKLLQTRPQNKSVDVMPSEKLKKLDQLATSKLKSMIQERLATATDSSKAELIAAQELLGRSKP